MKTAAIEGGEFVCEEGEWFESFCWRLRVSDGLIICYALTVLAFLSEDRAFFYVFRCHFNVNS